MDNRFRYAAFISYSSKDSGFARRLHRALESYGIPSSLGQFDLIGGGKKNRIYPVFRDREELSAGHLGDLIEANLKASAALIVVCSPNCAASPWVQKEIEYFTSLGRRDKIFAIISDKAPLVDEAGADATATCFPPAFRGDALSGDTLEPLAADARKGKDGFRNAWLKVIAGMLGVTPGQIVDRDKRLRRERMSRTAAVWAIAVLGVGYAYSQRATFEPLITSYLHYKPFADSSATVMAAIPGTTFQDCRDGSENCPVMVVVPEGTFLMGEAPPQTVDDQGRAETAHDERRRISIARFAVSQDEVTFADWLACSRGGGCEGYQPNPIGGQGDNIPATNLSWEDAQDYVRWLSQMTGHEYRLLTEAEWEFAARGVTSADDPRNGDSWSFGNDESELGRYAWFSENSGNEIHSAGTREANPFGLYDMYGNVWEWVEDCYADYDPSKLNGAAVETDAGTAVDSEAETTCSYRVARGGFAIADAQAVRSANRGRYPPNFRNVGFGFRVARTP